MMSEATTAAVRAFNRFYTRRIGVLNEGILDSPFSLTEVRVMYELAHNDGLTATDIGKSLGLDAGYLSRMLRSFEAQGLLKRRRCAADSRKSTLQLTSKGRKTFAPLDQRSQDQIAALLSGMGADAQQQLLTAMRTIRRVLESDHPAAAVSYRRHRPGDIGWAIQRHGEIYAREYGWDAHFEALVAEILGRFIENQDVSRERCWIAERDGVRVGCVFLVRNADDANVAQLRCLLVEPQARGAGIGQELVTRCIGFARRAGYRRMMLWTNDVLTSARRIYESAGFQLVKQEKHRSFGKELVGQNWEMPL